MKEREIHVLEKEIERGKRLVKHLLKVFKIIFQSADFIEDY